MRKTAFFVAILIAISYSLNAQINLKTEYFNKSSYLDDDTEEKLGKGSAIVYQADINIPIYQKINELGQPTSWRINFGSAYVDMNNKKFSDDLVINEIMDLYLGISYISPLSKKWSIMTSLGIGTYSSTTKFSKINSKNILGNGGIVFIRDMNKNLKLGGGVTINNSFGFPMIFPAIYLNWEKDGHFVANISLGEGLEASFGYSFSKVYSLSAIMEMNGQMALIKKDGKDKIFSHQYLVTGLKNEFNLSEKVSIPITAGINMVRMAEYRDKNLKSIFKNTEKSGYFDTSLYLSTGVNINL